MLLYFRKTGGSRISNMTLTRQSEDKDKDAGTDGTKDKKCASNTHRMLYFWKTGCSGILNMAFPPKMSTNNFPSNFFQLFLFHISFITNSHILQAYDKWKADTSATKPVTQCASEMVIIFKILPHCLLWYSAQSNITKVRNADDKIKLHYSFQACKHKLMKQVVFNSLKQTLWW